MNKRLTSIVLAMTILILTPINVYADETEESVTTGVQENRKEEKKNKDIELLENDEFIDEDAGEDTIIDEWQIYEINEVSDLIELSRLCRLDSWSRDKKVVLNSDLSLVNGGFEPIPYFGGYFDGQGHSIDGLYLYGSSSYQGMFSKIADNGVVVNLNVSGNIVPGGNQIIIGGIAGDNYGEIRNCSYTGNVDGSDYIGGIAGYNELSGNISDCKTQGYIIGKHFVGGIAGENLGNISRCENSADVNTMADDSSVTLSDIDISDYARSLLKIVDNSNKERALDISSGTVDTGGIAGMSIGVIQNCTNKGTIGYEHVGYNVGGIVGRHSGYIHMCTNSGEIYGRKDIGGIVGQAEPYIVVDFSQDIVYQLSESIDKLHDIISVTLKDAGNSSDTISSRLSVIQEFTDKALDDTSYLADHTVEWTDGIVGTANEAMNRIDYIMDEAAKKDGIFDSTGKAAGNIKKATKELAEIADDIDIYNYMDSDEALVYDSNKEKLKEITKEYSVSSGKALDAYDLYYFDRERHINSDYWNDSEVNEKDLKPVDANGDIVVIDEYVEGSTTYRNYIDKGIVTWKHVDEDGNKSDFPSADGEQRTLDEQLIADVSEEISNNAAIIEAGADEYARECYAVNHPGHTYTTDLTDCASALSGTIMAHAGDMGEDARDDAVSSAEYIRKSVGNIEDGVDCAQDILDNINARSDLSIPYLGDEYRNKTNSLVGNLKNMTDNMGFLNNEMSGATDTLIDDLESVNDQFNTIMLLYTDAIDGVLETDYTATYEDNSINVALECTDATVADCNNNACVWGDIDVAGIAGSMGIEYDYDLESDVTGVKDAKFNSTYETKCVLRRNQNHGMIEGEKSNVGGICGLQEMGTVILCENYGRIRNNTGDYAGGISGQSLSYIQQSFAKCALSGRKYVGGIAGSGMHINDCRAMVRITDAESFYGAIAGWVSEEGKVHRNYFVSKDLAGIDRISYSKKAEPVDYIDFKEAEEVPDDFDRLTLDFYCDDILVSRRYKEYGDYFGEEDYPRIPEKDGYYIEWNDKDYGTLLTDKDIEAEYLKYRTSLAGSILRDRLQSVILVDGQFRQGDTLSDEIINTSSIPVKNVIESYRIVIPDDGGDKHLVRYGGPTDYEDVKIYVLTSGSWKEADCEEMGRYLTFLTEGLDVNFAVAAKKHVSYKMPLIIAASTLAGLILIFLIVRITIKKRKSKGGTKKKPKNKAEKKPELEIEEL